VVVTVDCREGLKVCARMWVCVRASIALFASHQHCAVEFPLAFGRVAPSGLVLFRFQGLS
jgi:hypothetical protein